MKVNPWWIKESRAVIFEGRLEAEIRQQKKTKIRSDLKERLSFSSG